MKDIIYLSYFFPLSVLSRLWLSFHCLISFFPGSEISIHCQLFPYFICIPYYIYLPFESSVRHLSIECFLLLVWYPHFCQIVIRNKGALKVDMWTGTSSACPSFLLAPLEAFLLCRVCAQPFSGRGPTSSSVYC